VLITLKCPITKKYPYTFKLNHNRNTIDSRQILSNVFIVQIHSCLKKSEQTIKLTRAERDKVSISSTSLCTNVVLAAFSSYVLALAKKIVQKTRALNVDKIESKLKYF